MREVFSLARVMLYRGSGDINNMNRSLVPALTLATVLFAIQPAQAATNAETIDRTGQFLEAGAVVERLQVYEISGIVIIRGRTSDKAQAEDLSRIAKTLGYERVANLVQ